MASLIPELAKGHLQNTAIPSEPTNRDVIAERPGRVAVNG
jgi:hypothetical protein